MNKQFFTAEVTKSKDEDYTITAIGSQETIDRDNEVIKVSGIDIKNYKNNPTILWAHDYSHPPVGKATRVWKSGDKLNFKIKFAPPETYGFANTIYNLYAGGYLNAFSIGFIPDPEAIEYPKQSGKKKLPRRIYNKSELLELSCVPVPSNASALVQSRGIKKALEDKVIDDLELKELLMFCEDNECEIEDKTSDIIEEKKINYEAEIKILTSDINRLRGQSYLYRLFDDYKKEIKTEDDKYAQLIKELKF